MDGKSSVERYYIKSPHDIIVPDDNKTVRFSRADNWTDLKGVVFAPIFANSGVHFLMQKRMAGKYRTFLTITSSFRNCRKKIEKKTADIL